MSGWRASDAVGRQFFSQVAPCTDVPEFRGRFRLAVESGDVDLSFLFEFNFVMKPVRVAVWIVSSAQPDRYWLTTRVVEELEPVTSPEAQRLLDADRLDLDLRDIDPDVCEQEQIQFGGEIQSEGALVVLDEAGERVVSASVNLGDYLDPPSGSPVDRPATDLLPEPVASAARELAEAPSPPEPASPQVVRFAGPMLQLVAHLHRWNRRVYCEIVADPGTKDDGPDRLARWVSALHEAPLEDLFETACRGLADLSGFERVKAYQFDEDYHGEVVAEVMAEDSAFDSLLGLRFPATDIPPQARRLYVYNPSRFCSNIDSTPSPLASKAGEPPIDLSYCRLRTFSPYHLQYQRNLGVHAFYSLSLRRRGRLQGLLIGHHPRPLRLGPWQRSALGLLSATTEICLSGHFERRYRRQREESARAFGVVLRSLATWQPPSPPPDALLEALREQFSADGAGLVQGAHCYSSPEIDHDDLRAFVAAAGSAATPHPVSTNSIAERWPELAAAHPEIGGLLVLVSEGGGSLALVLWRAVRDRDVVWARSPKMNPGAVRRWVEARRRSSEPWTEAELDVAAQLQTEIERAFEPLWIARGLHDQTLQLDPSAILVVVPDQSIVEHNQTAGRMLGDHSGELPSLKMTKLVPDWDPDVPQIDDATVRPLHGEAFPARVVTTRTEVLGQARWMVYLQDLRPIRQLERKLREAQHLESIGTLAAGLAHDFNNCLAVIQANADLLALREGLEESEPLADLLAASTSGQALASELLTFTRTEENGDAETLDLTEVVQGSRRLLEVLAGSPIQLSWILSRHPLWVSGHRSEMHQVLFNLIANARDSIDSHGKIRVRLFEEPEESGPGQAVLEVIDDGRGMSPDVLDQVFDVFYTTKPRGYGTGLGLPQCQEIVRRSGGRIEAESRVGEGSTFRLRLPLVAVRQESAASDADRGGPAGGAPQGAPPDQASAHSANSASELEDLRVLLVEDRDDLRRIYGELIIGFGCRVEDVASAEEALARVEGGFDPDIVLTDFSLEGITGSALVRRLADRPRTGFLLVSGLQPDDDLSDLEAPVGVLKKPVRLLALREAMLAVVARLAPGAEE